MSMAFQNALKSYTAGKYRHSLALLTPLLKENPPLEMLLLAAQCHAKSEQFSDAAAFYGKAAEKDEAKRPMFKVLAAAMLMRANKSGKALASARLAARSGEFDAEAEDAYRSYLHVFLKLDECAVEDQRFLQLLKSGDPRYLAVEKPFDHITWCADEAVNAKMTRIQKGKAFTEQSRAVRRSLPHVFGEKIKSAIFPTTFPTSTRPCACSKASSCSTTARSSTSRCFVTPRTR